MKPLFKKLIWLKNKIWGISCIISKLLIVICPTFSMVLLSLVNVKEEMLIIFLLLWLTTTFSLSKKYLKKDNITKRFPGVYVAYLEQVCTGYMIFHGKKSIRKIACARFLDNLFKVIVLNVCIFLILEDHLLKC